MIASLAASSAFGLSITCLVLSAAVAAAGRERTFGRLRPRARDDGRQGRTSRRADPFRGWLLRGIAAAGIGTAGFWLAGPVGGFAGLVAAEMVRGAVRSRNARTGRDQVDQQLGEAIVTMAAAVRAGLSVRRALEEALRGSDPPLRRSLASLVDRVRAGQPIDTALEMFATELDAPDARLVTTLLTVHGRTGGDLPALLDEVAAVIGQRVETRRQVRALTAQGRASGAVLAVLPIAFVGLLSGTSGDGLGAFYRTLPGAGLLLGGLVCELLGFLWLSRIVRAEGPP
jgi:tight adherence protein B